MPIQKLAAGADVTREATECPLRVLTYASRLCLSCFLRVSVQEDCEVDQKAGNPQSRLTVICLHLHGTNPPSTSGPRGILTHLLWDGSGV